MVDSINIPSHVVELARVALSEPGVRPVLADAVEEAGVDMLDWKLAALRAGGGEQHVRDLLLECPEWVRENLVVSETAEQRGSGTDRFKRVVGLTREEAAAVRAGKIVAFVSGYRSGGSHGTFWRVAVDQGRYGFAPRVPSAAILAVLNAE